MTGLAVSIIITVKAGEMSGNDQGNRILFIYFHKMISQVLSSFLYECR